MLNYVVGGVVTAVSEGAKCFWDFDLNVFSYLQVSEL